VDLGLIFVDDCVCVIDAAFEVGHKVGRMDG
jgi:hypothetical protein